MARVRQLRGGQGGRHRQISASLPPRMLERALYLRPPAPSKCAASRPLAHSDSAIDATLPRLQGLLRPRSPEGCGCSSKCQVWRALQRTLSGHLRRKRFQPGQLQAAFRAAVLAQILLQPAQVKTKLFEAQQTPVPLQSRRSRALQGLGHPFSANSGPGLQPFSH